MPVEQADRARMPGSRPKPTDATKMIATISSGIVRIALNRPLVAAATAGWGVVVRAARKASGTAKRAERLVAMTLITAVSTRGRPSRGIAFGSGGSISATISARLRSDLPDVSASPLDHQV